LTTGPWPPERGTQPPKAANQHEAASAPPPSSERSRRPPTGVLRSRSPSTVTQPGPPGAGCGRHRRCPTPWPAASRVECEKGGGATAPRPSPRSARGLSDNPVVSHASKTTKQWSRSAPAACFPPGRRVSGRVPCSGTNPHSPRMWTLTDLWWRPRREAPPATAGDRYPNWVGRAATAPPARQDSGT
jgi:hypothetical protein